MAFKDILLKLKLIEEVESKDTQADEQVQKSEENAEGNEEKKAEIKKENKNEANDTNDTYPVLFKAIIEVAGHPEEHVTNTLKQYVDQIKEAKELKIVDTFIAETEKKDKLFSTFAELEIRTKKYTHIIDFCFDFMPASVEILEPELITFKESEFTNMLNDLQSRLHRMDALIKELDAKNKILDENSKLILRNNILLALKEKEKTLEQISKNIGIEADKTELFLDKLVIQGFVVKNNHLYGLNREKVTFSD